VRIQRGYAGKFCLRVLAVFLEVLGLGFELLLEVFFGNQRFEGMAYQIQPASWVNNFIQTIGFSPSSLLLPMKELFGFSCSDMCDVPFRQA
jgi:hypothetical protein